MQGSLCTQSGLRTPAASCQSQARRLRTGRRLRPACMSSSAAEQMSPGLLCKRLRWAGAAGGGRAATQLSDTRSSVAAGPHRTLSAALLPRRRRARHPGRCRRSVFAWLLTRARAAPPQSVSLQSWEDISTSENARDQCSPQSSRVSQCSPQSSCVSLLTHQGSVWRRILMFGFTLLLCADC